MIGYRQIQILFLQSLLVLSSWPLSCNSLIITSVIAGDKKFKTISFDTKFLKPLTFEKELPNTEFRRHRTIRPPKFDIDVNIPIKLPLEDQYEEKLKPVTSDLFLQTGEIVEKYPKRPPGNYGSYSSNSGEIQYGGSTQHRFEVPNPAQPAEPIKRASQDFMQPQISKLVAGNAYANQGQRDSQAPHELVKGGIQPGGAMIAQESSNYVGYSSKNNYGQHEQEFVPGGFINLQLSGPSGGPKMTYQDYDRERWAQQLSQTAGAMPYPILNYQQLQNFYGGLGTFTNGLPDNRYEPEGIIEKFKSGLSHLTSMVPHFG